MNKKILTVFLISVVSMFASIAQSQNGISTEKTYYSPSNTKQAMFRTFRIEQILLATLNDDKPLRWSL